MGDMSTQRDERIPPLTLGWRLKMSLGEGSVQEMADYLGVSRATVSRWMAGKGAPPKRAYVLQWALHTDVPVDWLESGTGDPAPTPPPTGQPDTDALRELTETKAKRRGYRGGHTHQYPAAAAAA